MKFSQSGSITLLLLVLVVFFAGCSSPGQSAPPVASQQVTITMTTTTGTPAVTTTPQPATTVQVKATESPVKVFNGEYHWAEYRENNTVTMPPNPRYQWEYAIKMERSTGKYEGSPAIHYKVTTISDYGECCINNVVTITKDGRIAVEDTYYDPSTNRFLGETRTETIKGVLKPAVDSSVYYTEHCRGEQPCGEMGFEPFGEMNITLTDKGTESVTVPAGTYPAARKYTGSFRDGTPITFWVAPGIPVPVQYQFPNKYLDGENPFQSFELKRWG
jgi:hypothetical protein